MPWLKRWGVLALIGVVLLGARFAGAAAPAGALPYPTCTPAEVSPLDCNDTRLSWSQIGFDEDEIVLAPVGYGGAFMMGGHGLMADLAFGWPQAEVAVMGAEGAVSVIYRRELRQAKDPAKLWARLLEDYRRRFSGPWIAAERGNLDDVIEPHATRPTLIRALRALRGKRLEAPKRRHENLPL